MITEHVEWMPSVFSLVGELVILRIKLSYKIYLWSKVINWNIYFNFLINTLIIEQNVNKCPKMVQIMEKTYVKQDIF